MLGYSERQAQRWWGCYASGGLPAVLEVGRPGGSQERITPEAWADLSAQMRVGAISRLKDAQAYLQERWGISYCLDGISKLFLRRKAKLKTGRPRHREADAAAQAAFATIAREHADALLVLMSPLAFFNRARLAELALQHRLPSLLGWRASAEAGGLLSYGPDVNAIFRRCAEYVDKILKGAKL